MPQGARIVSEIGTDRIVFVYRNAYGCVSSCLSAPQERKERMLHGEPAAKVSVSPENPAKSSRLAVHERCHREKATEKTRRRFGPSTPEAACASTCESRRHPRLDRPSKDAMPRRSASISGSPQTTFRKPFGLRIHEAARHEPGRGASLPRVRESRRGSPDRQESRSSRSAFLRCCSRLILMPGRTRPRAGSWSACGRDRAARCGFASADCNLGER